MINLYTKKSTVGFYETLNYILWGFIFFMLQTTHWFSLDQSGYRPNLTLILVIFISFSWPLAAAAIFAATTGLFLDSVSGGPSGLITVVHMIIFGLAVMLRQRFDPGTAPIQILVIFVFAGVAWLLTWILTPLFGKPFYFDTTTGSVFISGLVSVVITAIISPVFLWIFEKNLESETGRIKVE